MNSSQLDRIELDDAGSNPEAIATAIHQQLGAVKGPVPVRKIALSLDIVEIREEPLTSFEGALITTPERAFGSILVNSRSGDQRQRFSVAHELYHFLNPWHRPTSETGFHCSRQEMQIQDLTDQNRHRRQEAEANAFAIELLAPQSLIKPHLQGLPDLEHILSMSKDLEISKAAAARRYISQHKHCLALVFSNHGKFLFADRDREFPWIELVRGQQMPRMPTAPNGSTVSDIEEADHHDWFGRSIAGEVLLQTLYQQDGFATTMLQFEPSPDDDDADKSEDMLDRFTRYSDRDRA